MFGCAVHCYGQAALRKCYVWKRFIVLYVNSSNIITVVFCMIALDFGHFNLGKALLGNESQGFALCGDREGRGGGCNFTKAWSRPATRDRSAVSRFGCSRSSFQPVPTQIINCTAAKLQQKQVFGFSKNHGISLRKLLNLPFHHNSSSK